ncbi:conserved hypothetical protein [Ricinus communis]|uniref:Uncharacterized protein n=1 Tax=Ricinus communis TaxID=3988 RepID=B9SDJ1_RICCO|nr:conserved hypothetical protein [Ricinus communis]
MAHFIGLDAPHFAIGSGLGLAIDDKAIDFFGIFSGNCSGPRKEGNGSVASSSNSSSAKPHLANGGWPEKSYSCPSNDFTVPPGGISSLRFPVMVKPRELSKSSVK